MAQDTFVAAYRQLDQLSDARRSGPWVRRIAANRAADQSRALAVREHADLPTPAPDDLPDEQLEAAQRRALAWEVIDRLPQEQREVLLLFYIDDYSIADIASFLQTTKGVVRGRLQRARDNARDELEKGLRGAVRQHRRGKEFDRQVMSALPLVPLRLLGLGQALLAWERVGWGAALALNAIAVVGLTGILAGWWGGFVGAEAPSASGSQDTSDAGIQVRRMSEDQYWSFVDATRFADGSSRGPSVYGAHPLDAAARDAEARALRQGKGGLLRWEFDTEDGGWRTLTRDPLGETRSPAHAQVVDGALRVPLDGLTRIVDVVSPEIGYRAELFDRIEVRARVVHGALQPGRLLAAWTLPAKRLWPGSTPVRREWLNEDARTRPDCAGERYSAVAPEPLVYRPDWQIVAIDTRDGMTSD